MYKAVEDYAYQYVQDRDQAGRSRHRKGNGVTPRWQTNERLTFRLELGGRFRNTYDRIKFQTRTTSMIYQDRKCVRHVRPDKRKGRQGVGEQEAKGAQISNLCAV